MGGGKGSKSKAPAPAAWEARARTPRPKGRVISRDNFEGNPEDGYTLSENETRWRRRGKKRKDGAAPQDPAFGQGALAAGSSRRGGGNPGGR